MCDNTQMLHHLHTGSSVVPWTLFKGLFLKSSSPYQQHEFQHGCFKEPFIFMQRHKLAYEWDSGLTATSKGPDERVEGKCTLRQFKALQPC